MNVEDIDAISSEERLQEIAVILAVVSQALLALRSPPTRIGPDSS
jgi:hypothetical protein